MRWHQALHLSVLLSGFAAPLLQAAEPDRRGNEFFESKIRPVLIQHCYQCHSEAAKKTKGDLRVDTRNGLREGGESGPAVVPDSVKDSLLLDALRHTRADLKMPPRGKLPDAVIADFVKWVEMGAQTPAPADWGTSGTWSKKVGRTGPFNLWPEPRHPLSKTRRGPTTTSTASC